MNPFCLDRLDVLQDPLGRFTLTQKHTEKRTWMDVFLCTGVHIIPSFFPHKGTANSDSAGIVSTLFCPGHGLQTPFSKEES